MNIELPHPLFRCEKIRITLSHLESSHSYPWVNAENDPMRATILALGSHDYKIIKLLLMLFAEHQIAIESINFAIKDSQGRWKINHQPYSYQSPEALIIDAITGTPDGANWLSLIK